MFEELYVYQYWITIVVLYLIRTGELLSRCVMSHKTQCVCLGGCVESVNSPIHNSTDGYTLLKFVPTSLNHEFIVYFFFPIFFITPGVIVILSD